MISWRDLQRVQPGCRVKLQKLASDHSFDIAKLGNNGKILGSSLSLSHRAKGFIPGFNLHFTPAVEKPATRMFKHSRASPPTHKVPHSCGSASLKNPGSCQPEKSGVRSFIITSNEGSQARFQPWPLSRWRKTDNQDFQALPRVATHSQSTSFMRVCQPAPVPLKHAANSGLLRLKRLQQQRSLGRSHDTHALVVAAETVQMPIA